MSEGVPGRAGTAALDLEYPFTGRWLVPNSPANRIPSHGTSLFASSHAIDFVPLDAAGRTAPITLASLLRPEPAGRFPGFGRPLRAPLEGLVGDGHDLEPDHRAHRGLASIGYALSQGTRAAGGWRALAGNYVMIQAGDLIVALCHLRQGSLQVAPGDTVRTGQVVGR